ncbi:MAG: GNAT family N-acetyltransferase [Candidatus Schekmanbacteria bacterium]|nr:GNAT family N-acetyltransferase [Candidatus Schekmanbacteria bacterium]
MFTVDGVTLRPLEREDLDRLFAWSCDIELEMASGWAIPRSKAALQHKFEQTLAAPPDDLRLFGIEVAGELIGRIELALIDHVQGRAAVGLFLGQKNQWGRGYACTALRLMLDYAFTVESLARVYAEVYAFNVRSRKLMSAVGMTAEGVLRQHELHAGARHDMHLFGILRDELYARYQTIFALPSSVTGDGKA